MWQLPLKQNVGSHHTVPKGLGIKFVFVPLVDLNHRGPRLIGPIGKDESRRLPRLQPDVKDKPGRRVIGNNRCTKHRLNCLWVMDVSLGDITRHHREPKRLGEVDSKNCGVVMGVAVPGLGVSLNAIASRQRHAFEKILDVSVTTLAGVRIGLFIETE